MLPAVPLLPLHWVFIHLVISCGFGPTDISTVRSPDHCARTRGALTPPLIKAGLSPTSGGPDW